MRRYVILLLLTLGLACGSVVAAPILHARLDGSINPASRDYVIRVIERAERESAPMAILQLDTPGGLESSMRDIIAAELASSIPIVVFVAPSGARAASAGTFVTMAADVAAMAPGTNIGAAHPISLTGSEGDDETASIKAENDSAAFARSLAEQRGRNVEWAEEAVRSSSSLSASEALEANVIDLVAADMGDLLFQLDGYQLPDGRTLTTVDVPIQEVPQTLRERLLGLLADPNVVYILLMIGIYGLIFEFFSPGIGFGLAAGGVCLLLALFGMQVLPVSLAGIGLVLFGAALMVLDGFTPTNGILTSGGVVALVAGSLMLFRVPDGSISLSWLTIAAVATVTGTLSIFVFSKGLLAQRARPSTGRSALVGRMAVVRRRLEPEGTVLVHGEYWSARLQDGQLPCGSFVRIVGMEGRTLLVERAEDDSDQEAQDGRRSR